MQRRFGIHEEVHVKQRWADDPTRMRKCAPRVRVSDTWWETRHRDNATPKQLGRVITGLHFQC